MDHSLQLKKSLDHARMLRNLLARACRYSLYLSRPGFVAGHFSDFIQFNEYGSNLMKMRAIVLALGTTLVLSGCQNMDSNGLMTSGAEAFQAYS